MMRCGKLICLALLLGLEAHAAQAQDHSLKRLTLREDLLGWEAVGRVDIGEGGFCTGALIATDLVLTAAHCVFDPQSGYSAIDPARMRFRAGLRDDTTIAERRVTATVVSQGYAAGPLASADSIRHDLALLKLDAPIPAAMAAPFVVAAYPGQGGQVAVASYAVNRASALSIQRDCTVLGHDTGLFAFDCDVTFGSSGAPVFDMAGGRGRIISVVSAGHRETGGTVAYGADLPALVAELRSNLAAGRGVVEATQPQGGDAVQRSKPGEGSGQVRAGGALFVRPPKP